MTPSLDDKQSTQVEMRSKISIDGRTLMFPEHPSVTGASERCFFPPKFFVIEVFKASVNDAVKADLCALTGFKVQAQQRAP